MKPVPLLAAGAGLAGFNASEIESEDHYITSYDTSASIWPWRSYKTSPHHPPNLNITRHEQGLSNGYIFLSPSDTKGKQGTYERSGTGFIMTTDGDMIYAAEERAYAFCNEWVVGMTDFRKQYYQGRPYITYWNGCNHRGAHWGHRWGQVTFIDENYTNFTMNPHLGVNTLDDANRGQIDMHEHQMTDNDTMLVTSYNNTLLDLSHMGRSNETWVAESMFFEIDIATQQVLFQWSAMDHVPLNESHWGLVHSRGSHHVPWDWFHINSVQRVGNDYLISARHHHSIFLISGADGSVIWKLNGLDGGSFGSIPTRFRWQHHARAQNVTEQGMTISLFNNHVNGIRKEATQSQALAFYLPLPPNPDNPPQLVRKLYTPEEVVFAATQGSYQLDVGGGNGFVGYGKVPLLREYAQDSGGQSLRWEAWFGYDTAAMSYRALKDEWRGTPQNWNPVAVFESSTFQNSQIGHVYVSWNGATDISHWAVFAGNSSQHLELIGMAAKMGFETTFQLEDIKLECVQLGAVRDHKIIRSSNIACKDDLRGVFNQAPNELPAESDENLLHSQDASWVTEIENLEEELATFDSGLWFSIQLVAEFAIIAIATISFVLAFVVWRDRRRARGSQCLHRRSGSGVRLAILKWIRDKVRIVPRMANDLGALEEMKIAGAAAGPRHLHLDSDRWSEFSDEKDGDEDSDKDTDESDDETDSRTRLIQYDRQNPANA